MCRGDRVTAAACVTFSPEALLARLKQQLPLYMIPSTVLVRAELPRSPNGKFDRNLIRQEVQA